MRNPISERQPARWERPGTALALLVAVFFAANFQLLAGWAVEHWDGQQFFAPFFTYLAEVVRSGHWLLWNPFSNAGSPDFAEPQVGAFSPIALGFAALAGPSALAFRCYWLCVWLLGGVGMFVYARFLGAPVWGRLISGLAFVFSGYYLGHAQHISVIYSISFLPWMILRLDRAVLTGRRGPALEAGALWGLSALAGNPAVTISTALFVGAFAVVRAFGESAAVLVTRARDAVVALALFFTVGAVVLAPTYFSFKYESLGYSDRSGPLTRECVTESNRIEPAGLVAILNPYVPAMSRANLKRDGSHLEISPMYFGAVPLALALLALALPGARRWKWGVFGLALLFLGFTLGTSLPLRGWLYDFVPPTRYFRHPNMFRGYFIFAVLVLAVPAMVQIERWRQRGTAPAQTLRRFALLSALLSTVGLGSFIYFYVEAERLGPYGQTALSHAALVWIGLVSLAGLAVARPIWLSRLPGAFALLTVVDLLGAHYLSADSAFEIGRDSREQPQTERSVVDLGPDNFARAYVAMANQHLYLHKPVYCSYAAMLNAMHLTSAENGTLMGFATGHDRLWFSPSVVEAPVTPETLELLTAEVAARKAPILLWHSREAMLHQTEAAPLDPATLHAAPAAVQIPFQVETYRPNDLSLRVTCPTAGWLLITDRWSRSWRATVNGVETPIDCGNLFFRLVPVRAGENMIAMRFEPFLLWPLLTASWATLLAVTVVAIVRSIRKSGPRVPISLPEISTPPIPCGASS